MAKATALLPPGVAGAAPSPVLDSAKHLLDRITGGLASIAKRGVSAYVDADQWALRKAGRVLANGASKAAELAHDVGDPVASELKALASQAWNIAAAPLLVLAGVWLLLQDGKKHEEWPVLAALALVATRIL